MKIHKKYKNLHLYFKKEIIKFRSLASILLILLINICIIKNECNK